MTGSPEIEGLWQLTAEHSPVGMTLVSSDGIVLSANRSLCTMLGCTESDLQGSRYELLTHPDDRAAHMRLFTEMLRGERPSYRLTKQCLRLDGSVVWGDLSATLLRSESGEPLYVIGQISDVDQQRIHEEQLAEALDTITRQRQMSKAILDTVDVGLLLIDKDGNFEDFNRRHVDLLKLAFPAGHQGRSGQSGEVYADDGSTLLDTESMPTVRAARGEEFDDYRIWIGADPLQRRALSVSARGIFDAQGFFAGAAMAYSDITDLMLAIQTRDHFLASVSHELRTPLASVVGYLELLVESADLSDDALSQVEVIQRNAGRLHDLVFDLLESAQHRNGTIVLSRSVLDVGVIVREALEAALPTAHAAGVGLEGSVPSGVRAEVDPGRLRQVIDNLISNGVKYADAGDGVMVTLRRLDETIVLEVSDTGIGISDHDLAQLFAPFFRAERARKRHTPGLGLGLSISEAIVVAHGGCIAVRSSLGEGTTFSVSLPLAADEE